MGHIELCRAADLVVVAPATADLIAKLAHGQANDLASTLLLATDKRVLLAPAMNVRMWLHPATQRNLATVARRRRARGRAGRGRDGLRRVRPGPDGRAAGDRRRDRRRAGAGGARRAARARHLGPDARADRPGALHRQPLVGPPGHGDRRGAGPPRRARHLRHRAGRGAAARSAPPSSRSRPRARCSRAVEAALPADAAVFAAAVADWHVTEARGSKVKKARGRAAAGARPRREPRHPAHRRRPATTAGRGSSSASPPRPTTWSRTPSAKRLRKGADWIVANDVSPATGIMGGTENAVTLITAAGAEPWPRMSKAATAERLADRIAAALA